jgi:hypothetical protein
VDWNAARKPNHFILQNIMLMLKEHTTNIEIIFDAVGYDVIKLILENTDSKD